MGQPSLPAAGRIRETIAVWLLALVVFIGLRLLHKYVLPEEHLLMELAMLVGTVGVAGLARKIFSYYTDGGRGHDPGEPAGSQALGFVSSDTTWRDREARANRAVLDQAARHVTGLSRRGLEEELCTCTVQNESNKRLISRLQVAIESHVKEKREQAETIRQLRAERKERA